MPDLSRAPDFLHLHNNVSRRLRNLETGVHPTSSGLLYYDSFGPTLIEATNAKFTISADAGARWQRRVGITQIAGVAHTDQAENLLGEEEVATLPPEARPTMGLTVRGTLDVAPFFFHYRVQEDGKLIIVTPAGLVGAVGFHFDGPSWAVN